MKAKNKELSFHNQSFYIGIDVHQRSWKITIRSGKIVLKTFSMDPNPNQLREYMNNNYPGGKYYCVYEAGFCGYWIHRELESYGFISIIVSPNQVPTTGQEKSYKTDKIDSRKLSRELENGSLKGIYIVNPLQQEMRSLLRQRVQLVKAQTRLKNQIMGYLNFYGHKVAENYQIKHWSGKFIEQLRALNFAYEAGKTQLSFYLEQLAEKRKLLARTINQIKQYCRAYGYYENIELLMSVPGIGFITASTLQFEIVDINRFSKLDHLASYVGLSPSVYSTSDREVNLGLKRQHNRYLRNLLIEAAWIAVRYDPALTATFNGYLKRMSKQEAIVRIARKLLNRLRAVWKKQTEYVKAVVQ